MEMAGCSVISFPRMGPLVPGVFSMSTVNELVREWESLPSVDRRRIVERFIASSGPLPQEFLSQWFSLLLTRPHFGGIENDPAVCGGEPRIVRTRIPVWTLEQMRRLGISEAEILRSYPALRAEDLVNAWNYVAGHQAEIDAQIRDNEEA